jgi:hypothetical protein
MLAQLEYKTWAQIGEYMKGPVLPDRVVILEYLKLDERLGICTTHEHYFNGINGIIIITYKSIVKQLTKAGDDYTYADYVRVGRHILDHAVAGLKRSSLIDLNIVTWLEKHLPNAMLCFAWPESQEITELPSARFIDTSIDGEFLVNAIDYYKYKMLKASDIVHEK